MEQTNETITNVYEFTFLLETPEHVAAVSSELEQGAFVIQEQSEPREIRLAYPIEDHTSAVLWVVRALGEREKLQETMRSLRVSGNVVRVMAVCAPKTPLSQEQQGGYRQGGSAVPKMRTPRPAETQPTAQAKGAVTNEELEKKLEEILN